MTSDLIRFAKAGGPPTASILAAAQGSDGGELIPENRDGDVDEVAVRAARRSRGGGDHLEHDALDAVDDAIVDTITTHGDRDEASVGETQTGSHEMADVLPGGGGRILVEVTEHGIPPEASTQGVPTADTGEDTYVGPDFNAHMRRCMEATAEESRWHRPGGPRLVPRHGATIDRRDLTDRTEIVERMARDILAARRGGAWGPIDLTEHGWTIAQTMRHGSAAHELALTPAFAARDVVERLRDSEMEAPETPARPGTGDMSTGDAP